MSISRRMKRWFCWAPVAASMMASALALAADEPPENIDLVRLSVQHTLQLLDTGAERIFLRADIDTQVKQTGMLGRGVCLNIFMAYGDGSGGAVVDLEPTLSIQGQVILRSTCQGRRRLRDVSLDFALKGNLDPSASYAGFGDKPTLSPKSTDFVDGDSIGTMMVREPFDSERPVYLKAWREGLELDRAVYDSAGRLVRATVEYLIWNEKLAPEIYAAINDTKQETSREIREISLNRDAQGRIDAIWLQRSWNRFDGNGQRLKVQGSSKDATLKGPRELLARIRWNGAELESIHSGRSESVEIVRSPDRRVLTLNKKGERIGQVDFGTSGAITAIRDTLSEHTLFYLNGAEQLLAYLSPTACIHTLGKSALGQPAAYKVEMRMTCPGGEPTQWEVNYSYDSLSGKVNRSTRVIDSKGSRAVNNRPR